MTSLSTDASTQSAARLASAQRMVVKIGSALLVDQDSGAVRRDWLAALVADLAAIRARGCDVLLVSSGAIAVGRGHLNLKSKDLRLEEKQAAAATGQIRLAHAWQEALAEHGISVAQVLLTIEDTEERRRHLNARSTLTALLDLGVVPVVNENDTVATEEIRFGDNDRLAARVAQIVSADTLVLLSDIDGLYAENPKQNPDADHLPEVTELTPAVEAMAGAPLPGYSSGGMVTKIAAAKIAYGAGCRMVIADGRVTHPLKAVAEGARCTWFLPPATPRTARKRWIASAVLSGGAFVLDDGAVAALDKGRSLLPAGVRAVEGNFRRGDPVSIQAPDGREIARGLTAYAADDARRIIGRQSSEIESLLGYRGRDELVHRDDLVLTD